MRARTILSLLLAFVGSVGAISSINGQEIHEPMGDTRSLPPEGRLVRADSASYMDLVRFCAPVLWFSPDEPLLLGGKPLPEPLPFDGDRSAPAVYYRVITYPKDEALKGRVDPNKLRYILIDYFMYYSKDIGPNTHQHDLERFRAILRVDQTSHDLAIASLVAFAHGETMFNNTLILGDYANDLRWPFTILVEEGKHASCVDRNSDGVYSPGYDVNWHISDAWGIRDTDAGGTESGTSYAAEMAKVRRPSDRVFPNNENTFVKIAGVVSKGSSAMHKTYRLNPINALNPGAHAKGHLRSMFRKHGLVPSHFKDSCDLTYDSFAAMSLACRYDSGFKLTFAYHIIHIIDGCVATLNKRPFRPFPEVPIIGGHLLGKCSTTFGRSTSLDLLYTRSGVRWFDYYSSFGVDRSDSMRTAVETGVRFRYQMRNWKSTPIGMLGLRIGVRANDWDHLKNARLVVEFGSGYW